MTDSYKEPVVLLDRPDRIILTREETAQALERARKFVARTNKDVFMFILKPSTDLAAWIALKAYADATPNKELSKDLYTVLEQKPEPPEPDSGFHWRSQAEIDLSLIEKAISWVLHQRFNEPMSRRDMEIALRESNSDLKMELLGSVILMMMNDGVLKLDDDSNLYNPSGTWPQDILG